MNLAPMPFPETSFALTLMLLLLAPLAIAGVALDGQFLAWLLLADTVRPEAATALADLRDLGLNRQLLLTGDRQTVADTLAQEVGISDVQAHALPEEVRNDIDIKFEFDQSPYVTRSVGFSITKRRIFGSW